MAARALWKGQLRLSLVSIPVELYSATKSSSRIRFRQIHEPTGKPIRYEKVVEGVGPVSTDDIMKGFEYEKDKYLLIDPDDITDIRLETKKTLELVQFVNACEIPPIYFDKPYYLLPTDELAEDAYRVVRDALRKTEMAGIGQMTMRGKEYLVAVRPCGDGLLLETLHYADELREADPMFSQVEEKATDDELLDVATSLIERKSAPFDAAGYQDRYTEAVRDLIESKTRSKKTKRVQTGVDEGGRSSGGGNVIDLMSALKKSLEGEKKSSGRQSASKTSSGSKNSGRSSGTKKRKSA